MTKIYNKNTTKKKLFKSLKSFTPLIILGFFFFVFPMGGDYIMTFAKRWLDSLGIYAPIGYILIGIADTVIAPIGLGPLNIILNKAFGFWPSVLYYWMYEVIGMAINFIIAKKIGQQAIQYFFGIESFQDPVFRSYLYILNKSKIATFFVMLGFGGELLAYIAGLTKLKFWQFLAVITVTTIPNAMLFVGGNLTIGENNQLYILVQVITVGITFIPAIIIFHKEILLILNFLKKEANLI